MAAFGASHFDAEAYFRARPRYSSPIFSLIYAYHADGKGSCAAAADVGCGPGQLAYPLLEKFAKVTGVDPSEVMLAQARKLDPVTALQIKQPPQGHSISFIEGSGENTGLENGSVDLIAMGVTAHWLDWASEPNGAKVWNELARVLRPGGTVAMVGYVAGYVDGKDELNRGMIDTFHRADRLAPYFDTSNAKGPFMIASSYYDSIPLPSSSDWDTSATQLLKIQVDPSLNTFTKPAEPLPTWAKEALGAHPASEDVRTPLRVKMPLRGMFELWRSASAYVKFLAKNPAQKELAKKDEDAAAQWVADSRKNQAKADAAKALGKSVGDLTEAEIEKFLIPWDEEIEVYFPVSVLLARRSL